MGVGGWIGAVVLIALIVFTICWSVWLAYGIVVGSAVDSWNFVKRKIKRP